MSPLRIIVPKGQRAAAEAAQYDAQVRLDFFPLPNGDELAIAHVTHPFSRAHFERDGLTILPHPHSHKPLTKEHAAALAHVDAKEEESIYDVMERLYEAHGRSPLFHPDT